MAVPNLVSAVDCDGSEDEKLRREVERLKQELAVLKSSAPLLSSNQSSTIATPPEKSGYLFKWQDRSIVSMELFLLFHVHLDVHKLKLILLLFTGLGRYKVVSFYVFFCISCFT